MVEARLGVWLLLALALLAGSCSLLPSDDPEAGPTTDGTPAATGDTPSTDEDGDGEIATPTAPAVEPIVLGAVMARSGFIASRDEPALLAAEIEVERINEAGGVLGRPIDFRIVDTRSWYGTSFTGVLELTAGGAPMVLITCDADLAQPAFEAAADVDVVLVSPCSGDRRLLTGELGDQVFSMATVASTEGTVMADHAISRGFEQAWVFSDTTSSTTVDNCRSFSAQFRQFGGRVISQEISGEIVEPEALEMLIEENPRLRIRTQPDVIALCSAPPNGNHVIRTLRELGVMAPIISGSTMADGDWLSFAPDVGDFSVLTYASVYGDDPDSNVNALVEEFENRTGSRPQSGAFVTGADAIAAFAAAVERSGSLVPADIAAELERFDDEQLAAGPTTFTEGAHIAVDRPLRVMTADGRELRVVEVRGLSG